MNNFQNYKKVTNQLISIIVPAIGLILVSCKGNTNSITDSSSLKFVDVYGKSAHLSFLKNVEVQGLATGKVGICLAMMGINDSDLASETEKAKGYVKYAFSQWMEAMQENPRWPIDSSIEIDFEIKNNEKCEGFKEILSGDGLEKMRVIYYNDGDKFFAGECQDNEKSKCVSRAYYTTASFVVGPLNRGSNVKSMDILMNIINPAAWFTTKYWNAETRHTFVHEMAHTLGLGDQYGDYKVSMPSSTMKSGYSVEYDDKIGLWAAYHYLYSDDYSCYGFGTPISNAESPYRDDNPAICNANQKIEEVKAFLNGFSYGKANNLVPDANLWQDVVGNSKISDDWGWCWRYWDGYDYVYSSKSGCSTNEALLQVNDVGSSAGKMLRFKNNPTKCFAINKDDLGSNKLELLDCNSTDPSYIKLFDINKESKRISFTNGNGKYCISEGSGTSWAYLYSKNANTNCNTRYEILTAQ